MEPSNGKKEESDVAVDYMAEAKAKGMDRVTQMHFW